MCKEGGVIKEAARLGAMIDEKTERLIATIGSSTRLALLSGFHYLTGHGFNAGHGVSGVDYQVGMGSEFHEVVSGMVGGDDDEVLSGEVFGGPCEGFAACPVHVLAGGTDDGNVGVVEVDGGAESLESIHELEGGGFAHVVDVGLVGEAEQQDVAAVEGFAA